MSETSTFAECGLGGKTELPGQAVAQGHSGGRNGKYWRSAPMVGQTQIQIPRLNLFELLRRRRARSPVEPICETRALFCLVGIVLGVSGSSSSALATVEEAPSQNEFESDYGQTAYLHDSIVNFLGNSYGGINERFANNHFPFDATYSESESRQYHTNATIGGRDHFGSSANLDDALIPAAVWSLDVSTGVHLEQVSNDYGSALGMALGSRWRASDFWTRAVGLWADANTDRSSNAILLSSSQFQVASCGGASAEHPDLDRCGSTDNSTSQSADPTKRIDGSDATITPNGTSNTTAGLNGLSTTNQGTQPGALSPLLPATVNNFAVQVAPTFARAVLEQCDDTFSLCATTQINSPTEQIDVQTAPIDTPAGPTDSLGSSGSPPTGPVSPIGDSGPSLDPPPIFTPPPLPASPIPETSTEVMTMIGFGIMFLASRGRRPLNSIKHRVVGAFYKIANKSLHHYSA